MICLAEKEQSRMRKFKNFVAKCWLRIWCDTRSCGQSIWQKLDDQLPKAVGSKCQDEPRIIEFERLIKKLSFVEYYALKEYLRNRYIYWEESSYGLHTGSEEQLCVEKMQIYSSHYNVME